MMHSFHTMALLALPLIAIVAGEAPAATQTIKPNADKIYANANEAFQDLLNALPEESLHVALNSLTKFKDGVFESHRHGVEHVHHDNPPLATKLIVAAVQHLKERQFPAPTNGTAPTSSPTPQPSQSPSSEPPTQSSAASPPPPPPPSSSPPPAVIPIRRTTTDSNGQPTVVSSSVFSRATAFVPVDVTRTDDRGSTVVSRETKAAVIFTATDAAGSAFVTTSAVDFAPTAGQVLTGTDQQGSTFLTTYTPAAGRVSSIVLVTTIGADGRPSVVTSYTYVDPPEPTQSGNQNPPPGTPTAASLQTNAARGNLVRQMAVVGGVVGGAFMLFV